MPERPQLAAQAARWGIGGGAAWIAMCALARRRDESAPSVAAGLAWWLAVWRMLDWHLGMSEIDGGVPRDRLSAADAVTLARFWLVPLLPACARSASGLPAVIVLGGATDWLDGRLARRCGRTRLGRDLDTTADLAFLSAAAIVADRAGRLPPLAAWAFGLRHGLGLALSLAGGLRPGATAGDPSSPVGRRSAHRRTRALRGRTPDGRNCDRGRRLLRAPALSRSSQRLAALARLRGPLGGDVIIESQRRPHHRSSFIMQGRQR